MHPPPLKIISMSKKLTIRFESIESQNYTVDLFKGVPESEDVTAMYIGDPCYVFPDKHWGSFCEALAKGYRKTQVEGVSAAQLVVFMNDVPVMVVGGTARGDGVYPVMMDNETIGSFGVDSGMYAMIPTHHVEQWNPEKEIRYYDSPENEDYYGQEHFRVYTSRSKVSFSRKKCGDGMLVSSNLVIDTQTSEKLGYSGEQEVQSVQLVLPFL